MIGDHDILVMIPVVIELAGTSRGNGLCKKQPERLDDNRERCDGRLGKL